MSAEFLLHVWKKYSSIYNLIRIFELMFYYNIAPRIEVICKPIAYTESSGVHV